MLNLVGKKSVELGIKLGLVDEEVIIDVCGIPHAQCVIAEE
jgi:hypothetical protein